jgi:hypothetical protein
MPSDQYFTEAFMGENSREIMVLRLLTATSGETNLLSHP